MGKGAVETGEEEKREGTALDAGLVALRRLRAGEGRRETTAQRKRVLGGGAPVVCTVVFVGTDLGHELSAVLFVWIR